MRRIIVWMSVSLDGIIEGPNRELDWHRVDEELHQHVNDELRTKGAFLHGRRTYELMAGFWPTADQDPAASATTREFAGIWREMPKVVYSRTLARAGVPLSVTPAANVIRRGSRVPAAEVRAGPGRPAAGATDGGRADG
ncbi:dihydrofolate reductase family protein [Micromonospora sp. 4G57]|uniref:Dihydrofolate reductase family protein n=1 Tax=Micromonospora sicca TaxID=2202420 RepID=A0ABU5JHJ3_9ACTN|nr:MULTISPECIES: dihydrofolate reductase family protein [unclassified Micromonospora]MDZ5442104.1 dihydrofolate reductase family protein [Micromonospora sp. 4G57]MDZ5492051.1 dihydrofolate reductase family protein [Micromonospora sp. 4G53]